MRFAVRIPTLADVIPWLLLTFLVLFPKGGVKFAGIPLTWGYLFLGLIFIPLALLRLVRLPMRGSPLTIAVFASLLPFQFLFLFSIWLNGDDGPAVPVALLTSFIFLPAIFLGVFPAYLHLINYERFRRQFCFCILAAALWGIFLFFYHPLMGHYIEIPYLTVNIADYGLLETTKHIDRGGYLKLISTYNNGNLYGVATLILFPLYRLLEPKAWKRNVVRIALVLTLSRTVWFGLIIEQFLSLIVQLPTILGSFPRIRPGRSLPQIIAIGATVCLVLVGLLFNGNGLGFLFNGGLGGREGEIPAFSQQTLVPTVPVGPIAELVYASVLASYGIIGLLAFLLIFFMPVILLIFNPWLAQTPSRRAAVKGLILYSIVASIDGAILLIPVLVFYFFCYMVLLHGLPGESTANRPAAPHLDAENGFARSVLT
ncbi:hypothetical protein SAMN05421771_0975 [Granulicella pectinivorans]|uniref:Uncharacterized protein n=1 Tax=Granulicella pectinivorans TaxID=474950 RepID=A0A1I6LMQ1_9BACT|nr:hypothetical protein [Granulicella pectinivorans]SFS04776.1 hypothetical protein SAMN05421771_0975 [Granulicella pectinivorans]